MPPALSPEGSVAGVKVERGTQPVAISLPLAKWLHLDYYLDEFTFRFNRRTSRCRGKLFYRLLQQAVQTGPIKGQHL